MPTVAGNVLISEDNIPDAVIVFLYKSQTCAFSLWNVFMSRSVQSSFDADPQVC